MVTSTEMREAAEFLSELNKALEGRSIKLVVYTAEIQTNDGESIGQIRELGSLPTRFGIDPGPA